MPVIPYKQAVIIREDATLDTDALITRLVENNVLSEEDATYCRATEILDLVACDDDQDVVMDYREPDGSERRAFVTTSGYAQDKIWTDENDAPTDALREYFMGIAMEVQVYERKG